ncbi:MAG: IS4 family transposase [Phycisphaeraceae bacterium]|nr:IS4 family transposase [Phycisphaeraceae bacterium]
MMLQVLHGTSGRGALRVANLLCSVSAYGQAKKRLPLAVFQRLFFELACRASVARAGAPEAVGRWKGHRVMLMDGSWLSMPDTPPLQRVFGQPAGMKRGCGFPAMHLLGLFDQATGMIVDLIDSRCHTHDLRHASKLHSMLEEGDVLLGDRGFCSFAHLALLLRGNLHGLFALHQKQRVDFRPHRGHQKRWPKSRRQGRPTSIFVRRLGRHDQLVRYVKPKQRPAWMSREAFAQLPATITVRELRHTLNRPGFRAKQITLVTTLLDPRQYPQGDLAELYGSRWEVETRLLELKRTLGAAVLRSTSPQGVRKELWTYLLIYNLIRLLMVRQAYDRGIDPRRLSFIDARDLLRYHRISGGGGSSAPPILLNPIRGGRAEPRVIKRRKDRYRYMTRPRQQLRQELGITRLAA